MVRGTRLAAALVAFTAGLTVVFAAVSVNAPPEAAAALPGTAMPLQEFVNDGAAGRLWNAYDQTATSAGPAIDGRPSPIDYGTTVHVYARSSTGDLFEFVNDGFGGRPWNAYDLTQITKGPTISADPGAAFFGPVVHVYAEAPNGDLIEFVNDGYGGRLWNAYDLTTAASGPTLGGDPTPIVSGTSDRIFARSSTGDLVEYVNDGANGQLWNAYDLTTLAQGTTVAGDPNPVLFGTVVHVYAEAPSGDLVEFADDGANSRTWNEYDLTAATKGPTITGRPSPLVVNGVVDVFARSSSGALTEFSANNQAGSLWNAYAAPHTPSTMVSGDPSAVALGNAIHVYAEATNSADLLEFYNSGTTGTFQTFDLTQTAAGPTIGGDPGAIVFGTSSVHVYAGGPQPANPPGGVGVYGLSPSQVPQAIEDDWPIVGDTGALGTDAPPYTGINLGNDLSTGQDIQASGKRVTWLSFWTVSGPVASNADGSACYTSDCYYSDGYGAGQYVANTIDGYASQGLSLKPDYVILDPEGYPDNQSGLVDGPGANDTNWSSFLTGWAQGLTSIDPSLHPAFYADQYEYNTFDLAAIQLPAFIAVAFPSPDNILQDPSSNIAGFIAFGATCPASGEEQTLLSPPWDGTYNTLQFSGASYCAP